MTHHETRPFADCCRPEVLEHAIARLAAHHADHGVIAEHLRLQLSHLRRVARRDTSAAARRVQPMK